MSLLAVERNNPLGTSNNSTSTLVDAYNEISIRSEKNDEALSQYMLSLKNDPRISEVAIEPSHDAISKALEDHVTRVNDDTCEPGEENSFFICDMNELRNLYNNWKSELPRIQPFYAVKCNNDINILRRLASFGVNFDCASKVEIETILSMGVSPERIVYANPCKVSSYIRFAQSRGVNKMTFDNVEELCKIKKFHPDAEVILRITTDDSTAQCRLSTKYGADLESVRTLIAKCKELQLNLVGVSFHVGSGASDFSSLYKAVRDSRFVFDVAVNEFDFPRFKILDVGGGFQLESFRESSAVLNMALEEFFPEEAFKDLKVIAEPGRYFVATTFTLAAHVIAKRKINENESMIYINDGVYGNMNCILFDHQEPIPRTLYHDNQFHYFDFDSTSSVPTKSHPFKVSIWGPTCDGLDCIAKEYYMKHDLIVGDWFYFPGLGAYTSSAATPFNGFDQNVSTIYINESSI
ncbi:hypothetical protein KAFR_0G03370 [Kazachstania africana CBS 2517]|uniref:Ornithine decarboxylase n=1 Tax=Kazachstania africana (strain ATCC 22294 / BCRC 22015 / CBS 2517 / CECT 1963 / NBRC 1671 / NRRL Y-8276) TaxID=1071382 RepID=H2AYB9_KAZAF|nr:hypothetical protein KAFR_0G03370 [Kazachstania africana CBS 2517]CCF59369.1 hypothetical protein KAFR_0G03370 [Kazachstania africana CBS 2517]